MRGIMGMLYGCLGPHHPWQRSGCGFFWGNSNLHLSVSEWHDCIGSQTPTNTWERSTNSNLWWVLIRLGMLVWSTRSLVMILFMMGILPTLFAISSPVFSIPGLVPAATEAFKATKIYLYNKQSLSPPLWRDGATVTLVQTSTQTLGQIICLYMRM